ncbi:uncharacterized protein LOC121367527 [Gigantopelta aegis]|uniref:uncharacterized protein LOC121367527 n=1 Tax=Gigantopelta aegis TaxID=1735272 RepID=UPI001B88739A|nr:uncharacterized protein LOC121367527 [Gigantopelta aegis]
MRANFIVIMWLVTAQTQGDHHDSEEDYSNDVIEGSGRAAVSVIKCYKCAVLTLMGCDESIMSRNRDKFTVQCTGHCLNLTAGIHASYACTENDGNSNYCIENDGTQICVCNTNYCNGPPPTRQHEPDIDFELPSRKPPTGAVNNSPKSTHEQIVIESENHPGGLPNAQEYWEVTTHSNSCALHSNIQTLTLLFTAMNIHRFVP